MKRALDWVWRKSGRQIGCLLPGPRVFVSGQTDIAGRGLVYWFEAASWSGGLGPGSQAWRSPGRNMRRSILASSAIILESASHTRYCWTALSVRRLYGAASSCESSCPATSWRRLSCAPPGGPGRSGWRLGGPAGAVAAGPQLAGIHCEPCRGKAPRPVGVDRSAGPRRRVGEYLSCRQMVVSWGYFLVVSLEDKHMSFAVQPGFRPQCYRFCDSGKLFNLSWA